MWYVIKEDELYHHGIKGQKWGVRRFQNPDGTLTAAGRKRYGAKELYKGLKAGDLSMGTLDYTVMSSKAYQKREASRERMNKTYDQRSALLREIDKWSEQKADDMFIQKYGKKTFDSLVRGDFEDYDAFVKYDDAYGNMRNAAGNSHPKIQTLAKLNVQYDAAVKQYYDDCENLTKSLLGEYFDKPVKAPFGDYEIEASRALQDVMDAMDRAKKTGKVVFV